MGASRKPVLVAPTDPCVLAYLAGLIDGEGHIGITSSFDRRHSKNPSHSLFVHISSTDVRLMAWLDKHVGPGLMATRPRANEAWKVEYRWKVHAVNAEREQAEVALEFRELRWGGVVGEPLNTAVVEQREACKQRLHDLNKRGALVGARP